MPGTRRRIARRASGGVPKKPLKKERWLLVGCERVSVQDLILPSLRTLKGSDPWLVLTWKPVTLPIAWQGDSGQEGSGVVAVLPRTTVVFEVVAAPALAASATRSARQPASAISQRQPAATPADPALTAPCEDLDMPMLLSLKTCLMRAD